MVSDDLRTKVWERDRGVCQICNRKLVETVTIESGERIDVAPELENVVIYKWSRECWKCRRETPVVSYAQVLYGNYCIGSIKKLDDLLMEKYSFVKRAYSKTLGQIVVANTCTHCGSLQGNWFIMEDLIGMQSVDEDLSRLTDSVLRVTLTDKDLRAEDADNIEETKQPRVAEAQVTVGHVHHKDGDWENNELANLVLVCENCHHKLTAQLRKSAKPRRSRKQAREERCLKRETTHNRQQADRWRANYYAQKGQMARKQPPADSYPLDMKRDP